MNFLSHYYFNRFSRDPERVLGCVLPDLLRNADAEVRIRPEEHELAFLGNPKLLSIYAGWQHHMQTDRVFHNLPFFYDHTHALRLTLSPLLEVTPIRASFFSHIALELLLDHLLLVQVPLDEEPFYVHLESVDRVAVHRFLQVCGMEDPTIFFRHFDAFIRARYVARYREVEQVCDALLSICRRLWTFQLSASQRSLLVEALRAYANEHLQGTYLAVFDEIDNFF